MYIDYFGSPIGKLKITADDRYIYSLMYVDEYDEAVNSNKVTDKLKKELVEYFDGKRKTFDSEVKLIGTEYQVKVWTELMNIPYGETVSYKDIAINIKNPASAIAVGNANNKNKLLLLVPCHRVIGTNKKLIGFALGLEAKKYLLDLEKR